MVSVTTMISRARTCAKLLSRGRKSFVLFSQALSLGYLLSAAVVLPGCGTRINAIKNRALRSDAVVTTPVILSVSPPAAGTYGTGAALVFQFFFSEPVRTTPGTHLLLDIGGLQRTLLYTSGSGSSTLVYTYLVLPGEVDPNGVALGSSVELGIGSVKSLVGKDADLLFTAPDTSAVLVNAFQPSVTLSSATSAATNVSPIPVTVTFSGAVTGFNAADITVTGGTLSGFSGSGATYTFNFTPSGEGTLTANVAAGVAQDASANANAAALTFTRLYDITLPISATGSVWAESTPHPGLNVTANWTPSASADVALQRIQYFADATCATPSGAAVTLPLPSSATHGFTGVDGGIYTFRITSLDAAGNTSVTACSPSIRLDVTPPAAATVLSWTETSPHNLNSTVNANWTRSTAPDLAGQRIQYYQDATCTAAFGAAIDLASTVLQTRALTAGNATYTFQIQSRDTAGNSTASACSPAMVLSPTFLTSRGVLARYYFDEATSGTAVAAARDAIDPPVNLDFRYANGSEPPYELTWTSGPKGAGLRYDHPTFDGIATATGHAGGTKIY